jgi:hypothetical protein
MKKRNPERESQIKNWNKPFLKVLKKSKTEGGQYSPGKTEATFYTPSQ